MRVCGLGVPVYMHLLVLHYFFIEQKNFFDLVIKGQAIDE